MELGVELLPFQVRTQDDFAAAFAAAEREHADVIFVGEGALIGSQRSRILEFAAAKRLPSMFATSRSSVEAGGLMVYAENELEIWRRTADYIDRILKGAKPADLPMAPSAKFDLIINLRTARALGLTIPQSVLSQATEVIQ